MAELHINIKDPSGLLAGVAHRARIVALREIAADCNARADVLEAMEKRPPRSDELLKFDLAWALGLTDPDEIPDALWDEWKKFLDGC